MLAALVAACTASGPEGRDGRATTSPTPGPTASVPPAGREELLLEVVVRGQDDGRYLEGMEMAVREVNAEGGVSGRSLVLERSERGPAAVLGEDRAAAVLVIGPGTVVDGDREAIEDAGVPVILLGGDLYSSRSLFRQAFQTGPPVLWQSRVLARYAGRDRGYQRVGLLHEEGPDGAWARDAALEAFARDGIALDPVVAVGSAPRRLRAVFGTEALVVAGGKALARSAIQAVAGLDDPPHLMLSTAALSTDRLGDLPEPPPGTVAPAPYTWAGWAEPIPRVRRFRAAFERSTGSLPSSHEQEGYDAVRVLAEGLERAGGGSGAPLIRAMESLRPQGPVYSSLPATLGPDDHLFANEVQLGLFTVVHPDESDPWVEGIAWRPIIRTFTYNGERTVFLERDRRVFFPFWRKGLPSPKFHRSRHGIVTSADEDRPS